MVFYISMVVCLFLIDGVINLAIFIVEQNKKEKIIHASLAIIYFLLAAWGYSVL